MMSVAVKGWGLKGEMNWSDICHNLSSPLSEFLNLLLSELDAGLMYFLQLFVCAAKITFGLFLLGAVAQVYTCLCQKAH